MAHAPEGLTFGTTAACAIVVATVAVSLIIHAAITFIDLWPSAVAQASVIGLN
jgi:hypothetical protein